MPIYFIIGFALGCAFSADYYFHQKDHQQIFPKIAIIMVLMTLGWVVFLTLAITNKLFEIINK